MIQIRLAALALVGTLLASTAGAAADPVETRIRQLETAVNAAYAANDLPAYFAYYADDLRALFPEGPTTLPAYRSSWTKFIADGGAILAFKDSDMKIQVGPSRDVAVASYLASVTTRTPGKGVSVEAYAETDVWFRRAGQWKIVEIHYSETPPPSK